jgi:hypothetical protein
MAANNRRSPSNDGRRQKYLGGPPAGIEKSPRRPDAHLGDRLTRCSNCGQPGKQFDEEGLCPNCSPAE